MTGEHDRQPEAKDQAASRTVPKDVAAETPGTPAASGAKVESKLDHLKDETKTPG